MKPAFPLEHRAHETRAQNTVKPLHVWKGWRQ